MRQIGRRGKRSGLCIRKLLGEHSLEARAKLLAAHPPCGARRVCANKYQASGTRTPEALHFQNQLSGRIFSHAQDAARQITLLRPEMYQRLLALLPKFKS